MVISDNSSMVDRIKRLALHGLSRDAWKRFSDEGYLHYFVEEAGYKYNMMDIQAAIGIRQLRKIERFYQRRAQIWQAYHDELLELNIQLPAPLETGSSRHALHLFNIVLNDGLKCSRDQLLNLFTNKGIGVGVHYLSILEHPFYRDAFDRNEFVQSIRFGLNTISLPISAKVTDMQTAHVIESCKKLIIG